MRIAFLNTSDSEGGAARAAHRLFNGVRNIEPETRMIVQFKNTDEQSIFGPKRKSGIAWGFAKKHIETFPLNLYSKRERITFSPSIVPTRVENRFQGFDPEIIHLHWLSFNFVGIENIGHIHRPIVWTFHDSWPFTGGCHIPFDCTRYLNGCGRCPILGSNYTLDLSWLVWQRKLRAWKGIDLTIVTPSNWLAHCAASSPLFRDVRVEMIPNPIDIDVFRPVDRKTARSILGLPQDKKLIACGAIDVTTDRNKGIHLLREASSLLDERGADDYEIVIFGASKNDESPRFGLKTHYLGRLHDDVSLNIVYAAADLLVVPSLLENYPNSLLEAMACGTPCVAFNTGGISDLVEHKLNGFLASPFSPIELAEGIRWVFEEDERWIELSSRARQTAVQKSNVQMIASRYVELYKDIVSVRR